MMYNINLDTCVNCDNCVDACPVKALTRFYDGIICKYEIDQTKCVKCGKCALICPTDSITEI